MTIRYQCDECGSVLKVKDELAGTAGKCPKCKKKFVVPQPQDEASQAASTDKQTVEKGKEKPATKSKAVTSDVNAKDVNAKQEESQPSAKKSPTVTTKNAEEEPGEKQPEKPASKKAADDDFDVDAFLMEDGPIKTPTAGAVDAGTETPATSRSGRKRIVPPTPGSDSAEEEAAPKASGDTQTSANARDLLSKTMDDARTRASSMPEEKQKGPLFDFSGVREEAKQFAPYIIGFVVIFAGVLWMSMSMFASSLKLPELARVSGTVTINNEPFANVKVNLTPVDRKIEVDGKEMSLRTASGVTDENGYFEMEYMQGVRGAYVGKSRIWLEALDVEDLKRIPPQYISISNDIREVKKAGNEGKFNLEL